MNTKNKRKLITIILAIVVIICIIVSGVLMGSSGDKDNNDNGQQPEMERRVGGLIVYDYVYIDRDLELEYFYNIPSDITYSELLADIGEENGHVGSGIIRAYYEIDDQHAVTIFFWGDRIVELILYTSDGEPSKIPLIDVEQQAESNTSSDADSLDEDIPLFDNPKDYLNEAWKVAYYEELVEIRTDNEKLDKSVIETQYVTDYSLYDMDNDDIPELILYRGLGLDDSIERIEVYSYCDDVVMYIGEEELSYRKLYSCKDDYGIMVYYDRFDTEKVHRLSVLDGQLVMEEVASSGEYEPPIDVEEVATGAGLLSKYNINLDLPIVEYGITTEKLILSVTKPSYEEIEERLLEAISNQGKVYAVSEFLPGDNGYMSFGDLCKPGVGVINPNIDENSVIRDYVFADVNGDEQQELVVTMGYKAEAYEGSYTIILSLQDDIVYAYCLSYGYQVANDGMLFNSTKAIRYSFYKDECYSYYIPDYTNLLDKFWDAKYYVGDVLPSTDFSEDELPKDIIVKDICQGDIGNNGTNDIAVVFEYTGDFTTDAWYPYDVGDRIICIYTESEDGKYSTAHTNYTLIKGKSSGGVFGDPYKDIAIEDGMLKVSDYGGSSSRWGNEYYFGYWDDAFLLCKYINYNHSTHTANGVGKIYDYTTGIMEKYAFSLVEQDFEPVLIYKGTFETEKIRFVWARGNYMATTRPEAYLPALDEFSYDYFGVNYNIVSYIRETTLNYSASEALDMVKNSDYPDMKKVEMEQDEEIYDNWEQLLAYEIPRYYYKNGDDEILYYYSVALEDGEIIHYISHSTDGIIKVSDESGAIKEQ